MDKILMRNGQVYEIKKPAGLCCECFEVTDYWLHNARNYFCLSERCFKSRNRYVEFLNLKDRLDNVVKNLGNVDNYYE